MGDAVSKFLEPLKQVFALPKHTENNELAFFEAYARVLDDYSDDVLERAAEAMIRAARYRTMPLPADCIDACEEAKRAIELEKLRASRPKPQKREQFMWTEAMAKEADRLFASAWGRKAVADGVEIALWDFLIKQQRWPNRNEYEKLRDESLARQAETRAFLRIQKENGGINRQTAGWLNTMRDKSGKLKELVSDG